MLPAYSRQFFQPHTGFQVSTFAALKVGVYEGAATIAELKPHGNFWQGTLEGLDGETVVLNGKFYQKLNKQLPTLNLPYAIRLQETFPSLKVRSSDKQTPPYRPLNEVEQIVFELQNVRGTLVGFRTPQYHNDMSGAGYHFHLVTRDRASGRHLLDGIFLNPIVDV